MAIDLCCEPELIRVYWPGLIPESEITEINEVALATPITLQTFIDTGNIYPLTMFDGTIAYCSVMVYGSVNLSFTVDSEVVKPIPVPSTKFVGGRPTDPRR